VVSGATPHVCLQPPKRAMRLEDQTNVTRRSPHAHLGGAVRAMRCLPRFLLCSLLGASMWPLLTACEGIEHIHVATTGADTNPGTQAAPFATIARADAAATAGAIIHVAPGVYRVTAPSPRSAGIRTVKSGNATARIRFVSDLKWGAKIVLSGTGIAWNSTGAYVDIDGFDISGSGRIGILAEGGHETITNNLVHDLTVSGGCNGSGGAGIDAWGPVGGAVIDSNVVRNIGLQWLAGRTCNTVQGIYVTNRNNRVSNNVVSGIASVGINSWHGATGSTIINNTIFNSKMGIVIGQGDSGATRDGTSNNYVANNIVYANGHGITEMGKVGTGNHYVNNLVYSNDVDWRVKGLVIGAISADPLFVDYQKNGAGDYRLQDNSPAAGIGAHIRVHRAEFLTPVDGRPADRLPVDRVPDDRLPVDQSSVDRPPVAGPPVDGPPVNLETHDQPTSPPRE
jgi:hypothetical protein